MSILVTVSGEDSTSVILSSVLTELVSISGGGSVDVVASSGNSAIITVSSGDPISITGNYSNFVTGQVVRPPEIADFLTENQINTKITIATGNYNTLAANTFYLDSNPSGFITGVDLSSYTTEDFVTGVSGSLQSQISSNYSDITGIIDTTGSFVLKSETGSFVLDSETGAFYATSNPSGFITGVDLSNYVQSSETGILYPTSNPSGFITGVDLSSYVQNSETGLFLVSGEDASINALQIGTTPVFPYTRTVKLHDDGVQFGARLALIGTTDNGFPGIEMVTDGNLAKRTSIRHEGEGSNNYGLSFFTTNNGVVAEKVRFDGNGNVGIGTATPSQTLDVVGNIAVSGTVDGVDIAALSITVGLNTDSRHTAVTVVDSSEINFTLTGQQISATIIAGSIDEAKLDASVNTSLDLADSALQSYTETQTLDDVTDLGATTTNAITVGALTTTGAVSIGTNLEVGGHFSAATKSFLIDNPNGGKLQYGVIEGREHAVYYRGKTDKSIIELPKEWEWLVHEDSVTVQVTPIGKFRGLYVISQDNKFVQIGGVEGEYNYVVYGTRKDVEALGVDI